MTAGNRWCQGPKGLQGAMPPAGHWARAARGAGLARPLASSPWPSGSPQAMVNLPAGPGTRATRGFHRALCEEKINPFCCQKLSFWKLVSMRAFQSAVKVGVRRKTMHEFFFNYYFFTFFCKPRERATEEKMVHSLVYSSLSDCNGQGWVEWKPATGNPMMGARGVSCVSDGAQAPDAS